MPITYRQHQDTRDGKIYNCVLMPDGKWWLAENLAWAGAGVERPEIPVAKHGRLYAYADIVAGCAIPGCHVPDGIEWNALRDAPGVTASALKTNDPLWSTPGTNALGFNGIPSGQYWFNGVAWLFTQPENGWFCNSDAPYSWQPLWKTVLLSGEFDTSTFSGKSTDYFSVRLIVDVFNEPIPLKLFGAPFQGFERGLSCAVKRQILVDDSMGGSVTLTPVAPAAFDEWAIEAELWVSAAQAQALEAIVPPRGVPLENAIRLPPRGGEASFPGLLPFAQATGYDQYATPMVTAFESLGRKAPGVDLFGYRIAFSFFAEADGLALNGSPTPTTTPPTWLVGKFTAHQIQDWSSQGEVVAATTLAGHPSPRGSFYPIKHGRRRDVNFNLDHLSTDRANELVALFRGVRHNPVTVNMDRGPEGIVPTSVYLVDLSLQRGAGLWWDGTLKAVLA